MNIICLQYFCSTYLRRDTSPLLTIQQKMLFQLPQENNIQCIPQKVFEKEDEDDVFFNEEFSFVIAELSGDSDDDEVVVLRSQFSGTSR